MVVEGTAEPAARRLTEMVPVPTIGIGASPACDGQILVTEDILGIFDVFRPRFVKRYAELGGAISAAAVGLCRGRSRAPLSRPRAHLRRGRAGKAQGAVLRQKLTTGANG